jgi:hypothetical protein
MSVSLSISFFKIEGQADPSKKITLAVSNAKGVTY